MVTSAPASVRPVFVLGCPRSGTTLLQLLPHAHPRIALPPDNRFVLLGTPLRAYAERHGKVRWGDKRPAYALHVSGILRLFPDAQLVCRVRDGRRCVASLLWMPGGTAAWHELRFEDLVADAELRLRELCGYLDAEYAPEMTEPHRMAGAAVTARKTGHRRTHGTLGASRAGSRQLRLTPDQTWLCEAVLGRRLERHGYELSGALRPDPPNRSTTARCPPSDAPLTPSDGPPTAWHRVREPGPVAAGW
ncbi:sulfotransferase family protein [Streptomyces sp. NPDC058678]|uniref:sulfotransferase family protein n=1 Tax=Streptomyces sp. NPDC058678 TaxID=3346595 RepID=UPI003653E62D